MYTFASSTQWGGGGGAWALFHVNLISLPVLAGREMPQIYVKFLQFYMILGMSIRFSKTTANTVGGLPGGRFTQHSKWPPLEFGNIV